MSWLSEETTHKNMCHLLYCTVSQSGRKPSEQCKRHTDTLLDKRLFKETWTLLKILHLIISLQHLDLKWITHFVVFKRIKPLFQSDSHTLTHPSSSADVRLCQVPLHLWPGQEETLLSAAQTLPGKQTGGGILPEQDDQSHLQTLTKETVYEERRLWVHLSPVFLWFMLPLTQLYRLFLWRLCNIWEEKLAIRLSLSKNNIMIKWRFDHVAYFKNSHNISKGLTDPDRSLVRH